MLELASKARSLILIPILALSAFGIYVERTYTDPVMGYATGWQATAYTTCILAICFSTLLISWLPNTGGEYGIMHVKKDRVLILISGVAALLSTILRFVSFLSSGKQMYVAKGEVMHFRVTMILTVFGILYFFWTVSFLGRGFARSSLPLTVLAGAWYVLRIVELETRGSLNFHRWRDILLMIGCMACFLFMARMMNLSVNDRSRWPRDTWAIIVIAVTAVFMGTIPAASTLIGTASAADLLNILSDILTGIYAMVILLFRFGGLFVYEKDEQT